MRIKSFLFSCCVVLFVVIFAEISRAANYTNNQPTNIKNFVIDTLYIRDTEAKFSKIFWQPDGGVKSLLLSLDDTLAAGFANDSCKISVELMQIFYMTDKNVIVLPSKAHPDSLTYPGGKSWFLWSALEAKTIDTAALYLRGVTGTGYTDKIGAATTPRAAYVYMQIAPDFSPGICLRITGLNGNAKRATGSRIIIRWIQEIGSPVLGK